VRTTTALLIALTVAGSLCAAFAENGLDERSPFGIVCPWTDIGQTGARWTRCGAEATELVNWPGMEPAKGKIDFTKAENELGGIDAREKLFPLPILGYTAPWAGRVPGKIDSPPKNLADWDRWVNACADHFRGRVKFWEVWNEPNIEFFNGSIADYANLVKTASAAVRRADPSASVLMGTAGVDLDFIRRCYECGCGPYYDVISVHPYQWDPTFNDGWFIEKLTNLRKLMDSFGDTDKRIWLTELGWATSDKRITPDIQARLLVQAYVTALSLEHLGVDKIFWFCVKDWGGPGYGIYNDDSTKKPAWFAYQTMTGQLAGRPYMGKVGIEGARCYAFGPSRDENDAVLCLWAPGMDAAPTKLDVPVAEYAAYSISGEKQTLKLDADTAVTATPAPQYVHVPVEVAQRLAVMTDRREFPWPDPAAQQRPSSFVTVMPQPNTERPWLITGQHGVLRLYVHNGQAVAAEAEIKVTLGSASTTARVKLGAGESRETGVSLLCPIGTKPGLADLKVSAKIGGEEIAPQVTSVRVALGPTVEFLGNSYLERSMYLQPDPKSGCSESMRFGSEWTYKLDAPQSGSALVQMDVGANMAQPWTVSWSQDNATWSTLFEGQSWHGLHEGRIDGLRKGSLYLRCKGTDEQFASAVVTFVP
jgi:hypothetical protein